MGEGEERKQQKIKKQNCNNDDNDSEKTSFFVSYFVEPLTCFKKSFITVLKVDLKGLCYAGAYEVRRPFKIVCHCGHSTCNKKPVSRQPLDFHSQHFLCVTP